MPSVWEQRWAEYVRRLGALRESSALELLPDLMPVLPVVDPSAEELLLARRERRFACNFNLPGSGVGNYYKVMLWNGSVATLGILERWNANASTNGFLIQPIVTDTADAPNVVAALPLDLRGINAGAVTAQQQLRASYGAPAVAPTGNGGYGFMGSVNDSLIEGRIVIPPGTGVILHQRDANTTLRVSLEWRERRVDPAELNATGA